MKKCVFISYRREDSRDVVGPLSDGLVTALGDENVFLDVDSIPLGADFRHVLHEEVGRCDVLIAVIGPGWLTASDSTGRRRLDDPDDFVRVEVEAALERDTPVLLALVHGAQTPPGDQLPASLQPMATSAAVALEPGGDLQGGVERLLALVRKAPLPLRRQLAARERWVASVCRARNGALAGALLGVLVPGLLLLFLQFGSSIRPEGLRQTVWLLFFLAVVGAQPMGGAVLGWRLARAMGAVCGLVLACLHEGLLGVLPTLPGILAFRGDEVLTLWADEPPVPLRLLCWSGVQVGIAGMGIAGLAAGTWAMSRWPKSWVQRGPQVLLSTAFGALAGALVGCALGVTLETVAWYYSPLKHGTGTIFLCIVLCEFITFGGMVGFLSGRKPWGFR
jgi:TIR domain